MVEEDNIEVNKTQRMIRKFKEEGRNKRKNIVSKIDKLLKRINDDYTIIKGKNGLSYEYHIVKDKLLSNDNLMNLYIFSNNYMNGEEVNLRRVEENDYDNVNVKVEVILFVRDESEENLIEKFRQEGILTDIADDLVKVELRYE